MMQDEAESADSGGIDGHRANRRAAPRFTLLIRAARLVLDGRDHLCVIRDVSATGMKIRLFHPLPPHRSLAIGLGKSDCIAAHVAWTEGDHVGLRFHAPQSVEVLLDAERGSEGRQPLQLAITLEALVHAGCSAMPARIVSLAQQAARIEVPQKLVVGEQVRLQTAMLPPLLARVRSQRSEADIGVGYDLEFDSPFRLDELARAAMAIHISAGALSTPTSLSHASPSARHIARMR